MKVTTKDVYNSEYTIKVTQNWDEHVNGGRMMGYVLDKVGNIIYIENVWSGYDISKEENWFKYKEMIEKVVFVPDRIPL